MKNIILSFVSLLAFMLAAISAENRPAAAPATSPPAYRWLTNLTLASGTRTAVINESVQALRSFKQINPQGDPNNEIPKAFWGEAISKLKPLRVQNDHLNILIVLQEDSQLQEGLYVSNPISSYAVNDKRFVRFELISKPDDRGFGSLYRYQRKKN